MCGIAGMLRLRTGHPISQVQETLREMTSAIRHRGPDSDGHWFDDPIALGHRRLAIVELSESGQQPMLSNSGRFSIVFNGEIYNHLELRKELEAGNPKPWRGLSDTETLIELIDEIGLERTLEKVQGMFALAVWDRKEQVLDLAIDRLGEKPLYFGCFAGHFIFASELKAFRKFPRFSAEIDPIALSLFFRHSCIPAPYSIYQGVQKLLPGHCLRISPKNAESACPSPYWSIAQAFEKAQKDPFRGSDEDALEALTSLLTSVVKRQTIADVPLGAFLSGGIDSSLIVAMMQAHSSIPVRTFTIGFNQSGFDESKYAAQVAAYLGTHHTQFELSPEDAYGVIPNLPELFDEPFADSSQIPTFLVAKMARSQVTVALSGDGGDELFGGYNRHIFAAGVWPKISRLPKWSRSTIGASLARLDEDVLKSIVASMNLIGSPFGKVRLPLQKIRKLGAALQAPSVSAWYQEMLGPGTGILDHPAPLPSLAFESFLSGKSENLAQRVMLADMIHYLPADILTKVDRATMGVSLESRAPFLDHRLVEFSMRIPESKKIRSNGGKWILKQVLRTRLPKGLFDRPKMGFAIPAGDWLRGPLKTWASDLLSESALNRHGLLNKTRVSQEWKLHLSGKADRHSILWPVLMFQAWYAKYQ